MATDSKVPILIPIEVNEFWLQIQSIIREEVRSSMRFQLRQMSKETSAFQFKPIYSMESIRNLFDDVSRTTIYEWIKCGKLKPRKLKGKIYFLWADIEKVLNDSE